MPTFTTRPELAGCYGMVASTHWIASAVGMKMLEEGGNAFDAAVAAGLVLQVVEPHLCGPAGDLTAVVLAAAEGRPRVLCGQGTAPAAATIAHYHAEGLRLIPGDGLLATVIPGAWDAWMLLLRDYGRLPLERVLGPAIWYADQGHPPLAAVCDMIAGMAQFFEAHWSGSHRLWLPGGTAPSPRGRLRNPALARTWRRILAAAGQARGRVAQIEAARAAFRGGFVAEAVDRFLARTEAMDASGMRHRGVLTGEDMARWEASWEPPATVDYHGWTVAKTGPWGQGPVLLQSLALLRGIDLAAMDPAGPDFVHTVAEAMKLAYADREAYYGDPAFTDVPLATLLSEDYAAPRRTQIGADASLELRPGRVPGFEAQRVAVLALLDRQSATGNAVYEPTMAHLSEVKGDTVHLDAVDGEGNMVSVTPSGGWLQSSPAIEDLGFCLNTRAQMFWLEPGLPASLAPGKRPRTTLTPSLALHQGGAAVAFGSPGGDQQDQWQLAFFLRHVHHGMNLQEAIDAPLFHSMHFPSSFFPRSCQPGRLVAEAGLGEATLALLRDRGHRVQQVDAWTAGRLTAAARDADGTLRAAATPRLMQAYAVGR